MHAWLALSILAAVPSVTARLQQAARAERAGNDAAALREVDAALGEHPTDPFARLEAARLRLKLGQALDEAEQHLETARALAPENPRVQFLWGQLLEERSRVDEAIRAYELAVMIRPLYEDARFRLGALYFSRQDWLRAEHHYRELTLVRPDWLQARLQLARVIEHQGRTEDAEAALVGLLEEQPSSLPARRALAELYDRAGRPERAAQVRREGQEGLRQKKMRPLKKSRR